MAKRTLLDIVQEILNDMDSDEVTSINDTIESLQVANIVRSCYPLEYKHAAVLRLRFVKILQDKIDAERKNTLKRELYDSGNWGLKQADSIGYIRALEETINLMQENKEKKSIS